MQASATPTPPAWGPTGTCWQCGAPAAEKDAYNVKLYAAADKALEAFGQTVERGRRQDKVVVAVPRCPRCRARAQDTIASIVVCAILGAIFLPPLFYLLFPHFQKPDWLEVHTRNGGDGLSTQAAIGLVAGIFIGAIGARLARRGPKPRSVLDYPQVVRLRENGWDLPSG